MVLSSATKATLMKWILVNIPEEQKAGPEYEQFARVMEQAANEATLGSAAHFLRELDVAILRGYATTLRQMAADERRHRQNLETMRNGLSQMKATPNA